MSGNKKIKQEFCFENEGELKLKQFFNFVDNITLIPAANWYNFIIDI